MKTFFCLIIGLLVSIVSAQKVPQTIYCNEHQNVTLVMKAPIAQAVTGSEDFVFSYNQTKLDSLGLLQGRPGKDSNLLIRTTDGSLYSYILKYGDSLSDFVHFIRSESRINPIIKEKDSFTGKKPIFKPNVTGISDSHYEKLSGYYLNRDPFRIAVKRKDKIKLEVQGVYHYRNKVFMVLSIQNKSTIDFEVDVLSMAKIHGIKGKRSSFQKLIIENLYRKGFPSLVKKGEQKRFVMVYPKFTLGDHEQLEVVLNEKNGSRYLNLRFD